MPTIGWFEILIIVVISIVVLGLKFSNNVKKIELGLVRQKIY